MNKLGNSEKPKAKPKGQKKFGKTDKAKPKANAKTKPNKWMTHVATVKAKNKGMAYKEVLKKAKESYKRE